MQLQRIFTRIPCAVFQNWVFMLKSFLILILNTQLGDLNLRRAIHYLDEMRLLVFMLISPTFW